MCDLQNIALLSLPKRGHQIVNLQTRTCDNIYEELHLLHFNDILIRGSSMQHIQIKVLQCDKRHLPKILESSILSHLLLVFPLNSIWDSYKAARAIITANDTDSSSLDTFYSTLNSARLGQLKLLSASPCVNRLVHHRSGFSNTFQFHKIIIHQSTEHVAHFSFTKL